MQRHVRYGDVRIAFAIRFVKGRARSIAIHILPEGTVQVDAPEDVALEDIVRAVGKRARWIWQQLEAWRERMQFVLPREYVSGESHLYLGKRYVLKVIVSKDADPAVKLLGGRLEVMTGSRAPEVVRSLLDVWYRQRAGEVFERRIAELSSRISWLKTTPAFRLRNMRTQWGSCSPKGVLLLNPNLVKAPRSCVDYVVSHELCHLKEHNHSAGYYRLLGKLMPDWEGRKRELDEMAEILLNR